MLELISVIIPVYNVENYLEQCLTSLLNQTYNRFEVICIDDGSTDTSADIIRHFVTIDNRFKYVFQENAGQSSARNLGLSYANGTFVTFVDSDDFVVENYLETLINVLNASGANIAMCDYSIYFEQDNHYTKIETGPFTTQNILHDPSLITNTTSVCNKMFRMSIFEHLRFVSGIRYEDVTFTAQAILVAKKLVKVDISLYNYRMRSGENISTMQKVDNKIFDIYKALEILDEWMMDDYYDELEYLYIKHLLVFSSDRMMLHPQGIQNINNMLQYMNTKFPNWSKNKYTLCQEPAFSEKFELMLQSSKNIERYYRNLKRREFAYKIYRKLKCIFVKQA